MRWSRFFIISIIALAMGCSARPSIPASTPGTIPREVVYTHTVTFPEENIMMLADWYTGNPANWKRLRLSCNPIAVRRLGIGTKVLIPEDLMSERHLISREYIVHNKYTYEKAWTAVISKITANLPKNKLSTKEGEVPLVVDDSQAAVDSSGATDELIENLIGDE